LVELVPDFVTEEYKAKNQRVRPESSMSQIDQHREEGSRLDGEPELTDEKFNEEIEYMMKD
jgi:hypothetical protein